MLDVNLDVLSKYIIQNNPTEVKHNLMKMRLVDSNFQLSHDNFKALLASLPQEPQYLADVTANALNVLIDGQASGSNYLRALQSTSNKSLGEITGQVAQSTFNAAAQVVASKSANNEVAEKETKSTFGQIISKSTSGTSSQKSLTVTGWVLLIIVVLALIGGIISWVSYFKKRKKKSPK